MIKSHDFASTYVGTPFYMSPEICAAEKYTLKSDIWSLGCIIYELCSREPPFNAKTHYELVQKIKAAKVPPLPSMYSSDLNQVIKDCLRVNPDQRPDTARLLNLPVVRLMRKEKEVVDLNKQLRVREEAVTKKEKQLSDALAALDREKTAIREEIDSSLRREWEVKARLEIDRRVQAEGERLLKQFELEIQARVAAALQKKTASPSTADEPKSDPPRSSISASSGDEFPSETDATDLSVHSSDSTHHTKEKEARKMTRTPFARAQTMFAGHAGTPMDVEMASPSPIAIASLSLSPRRTEATKAPHVPRGNIFSANNGSEDPEWALPEDPASDESDVDLIPSPTRQLKSMKKNNPFTSKTRPVLTSQKTCPVSGLKPASGTGGLVSKVGLGPPPPAKGLRSTSPNRRLSKIPSVANLAGEHSAHGALNRKAPKKDSETLGKVAAKNNIKGRTLVELQQARSGIRSVSPALASGDMPGPENYITTSPKRRGDGRTLSAGDEPAATWDPERDEMPSPFLLRTRSETRV